MSFTLYESIKESKVILLNDCCCLLKVAVAEIIGFEIFLGGFVPVLVGIDVYICHAALKLLNITLSLKCFRLRVEIFVKIL